MTAYLFIIGFASFGHYLFPYPQEAVFATAGYVAASSQLNIYVAMAACVGASFVGDLALYLLARGGGRLAARLIKGFPEADIARLRTRLGRHTLTTIVVMRLFPMSRMLVTVAAGLAGVSVRTYVVADLISLVLVAPLFFLLGHRSYAAVMQYLDSSNSWLPWVVLLVVTSVGYAVYAVIKRRQRKSAK